MLKTMNLCFSMCEQKGPFSTCGLVAHIVHLFKFHGRFSMKKKLGGLNLVNLIIARIDALLSNWVMRVCTKEF
jgi:hypothetical protein